MRSTAAVRPCAGVDARVGACAGVGACRPRIGIGRSSHVEELSGLQAGEGALLQPECRDGQVLIHLLGSAAWLLVILVKEKEREHRCRGLHI